MSEYRCKISPGCQFTFDKKREIIAHIAEAHPHAKNVKMWRGTVAQFPFQICRVRKDCNYKCLYVNEMIEHICSEHPGEKYHKEAGKWIGG